jgi:hypothetical protein
LRECVKEVAFGSSFVSVFGRMVEVSMCTEFIRVSVEVGNASGEWEFSEEGVDVMKRAERNGVQQNDDEMYDSVGEIGGDRGVGDLFLVEVSEG